MIGQREVQRPDSVERRLPSVYPMTTQLPRIRRVMSRRSRSLIALFALPIAGGLVFGVGAARSPSASESSLRLEASLSQRTLTVMRDGEVVKSYSVAIGAAAHPTPTGTFNLRKIVWNVWKG